MKYHRRTNVKHQVDVVVTQEKLVGDKIAPGILWVFRYSVGVLNPLTGRFLGMTIRFSRSYIKDDGPTGQMTGQCDVIPALTHQLYDGPLSPSPLRV